MVKCIINKTVFFFYEILEIPNQRNATACDSDDQFLCKNGRCINRK